MGGTKGGKKLLIGVGTVWGLYRLSPQKITTGLLASITFKLMNQFKYALGFQKYNLLSAFCRKPHPI